MKFLLELIMLNTYKFTKGYASHILYSIISYPLKLKKKDIIFITCLYETQIIGDKCVKVIKYFKILLSQNPGVHSFPLLLLMCGST